MSWKTLKSPGSNLRHQIAVSKRVKHIFSGSPELRPNQNWL